MISFRTAIAAIFAVLVVHGFGVTFDLYDRMSWLDIPMHFFGGYVIALLGLALFGWILDRLDIKPKRLVSGKYEGFAVARFLLEAVFIIGFVMIVGVAWEWYEFVFDQLRLAFSLHIAQAQMGLADTMDDLVNDTLGAITAWLLWREKP